MSKHIFSHTTERAQQISGFEAVRLMSAFRRDDEDACIQILPDIKKDLEDFYIQETFKGRDNREKRLWKYKIRSDGKVTTGRTNRLSLMSLSDLQSITADDELVLANLCRCGIYWTVNSMKHTPEGRVRRSADHVARVAAVFIDLDGEPLPDLEVFPLPPTAIVESSSGKYHVYWAVDGVGLDDFPVIQKFLASQYNSDPMVCDLPRVMRLPGFYHNKTAEGFITRIVDLDEGNQYHKDHLLEAWPELTREIAQAEENRARILKQAKGEKKRAAQLRTELNSSTVKSQAEAQEKYAEAALLDERAKLASTGEGGRNHQLYKSAATCGELIGAGVLDEGDVWATLEEIARSIGLGADEIAKTLNSGLVKGKSNPRDLSGVGTMAGRGRKGAKKTREDEKGHTGATKQPKERRAPLDVTADDIPEPDGQGESYSDAQLKEFLKFDHPVMGITTDKAHSFRLENLAKGDMYHIAELGGYVTWGDNGYWLSGGKDGAGNIEARKKVQKIGIAMKSEIDVILELYYILDRKAKELKQDKADSNSYSVMARKARSMEQAYYRHIKAAQATESDMKQKAILSAARPIFRGDVKRFTPKPWVIGFQNGTWDKGEWREHRQSDHMLTLAAVAYHKGADKTLWLEVLDRITGGDKDFQKTLLHIMAYALSGASSWRAIPIFYGPAGTGKSTLAELLMTILGDMGATIDPKLLATDAARERLGAAVWNKRLALLSEAGNTRLDAEALKMLSGSDRLAVRMLYSEGFTAQPTHMLLLVANDPPRVEAYDQALRERLFAVPCIHRLDDGPPLGGGKRIEELRKDPTSDLVQGATAWIVEGLPEVMRDGLHVASVCEAANKRLWQDVDPLTDFWLEQNLSELTEGVRVAEFRKRYELWCSETGGRALGKKNWTRACESVGLGVSKLGIYSQGKRRQLSVWKLLDRKRYPTEEPTKLYKQNATHGSVLLSLQTCCDRCDHSEAVFPKVPIRGGGQKKVKDFRENALKTVTTVTVDASGNEPLSPSSGEL